MPVLSWWRIDEGTIHVLKNPQSLLLKLFTNKSIEKYTSKQVSKLKDDFADYFGIGKKHIERLELMAKIQVIKVNFALDKDRSRLTMLEMAERELEALSVTGAPVNEYEIMRSVSMALGAEINPKEDSVIQYYSDQNAAVKLRKK